MTKQKTLVLDVYQLIYETSRKPKRSPKIQTVVMGKAQIDTSNFKPSKETLMELRVYTPMVILAVGSITVGYSVAVHRILLAAFMQLLTINIVTAVYKWMNPSDGSK
jgi:hypothetical protein